ncbi:hypothetical protein V6B16_11495 [Salinimicrobium catena]|uniref:hypothetical protein n=1 Tax=Salinimicrobium catena TaxID=390640 RepID=UPI002FE4B18E
MSLLSTKDFADFSGVKIATLRQHIKRGKVEKTGSHIDTEHPTNVIYLTEQWTKNGKPKQDLPKETEPGVPTFQDAQIKKPEKNISVKAADWALRKKQADALISERRAQELFLKNQKLQGELMPIELVQKVLVINIQSIFRSFESSAENIASIYNERLGGDRAALTEMITRMREELERAIHSAKQQSQAEITALMREYSATRSRGEKK